MENQNKPAYPVHGIHENLEHGLTKLEHFAGLAMQGLLANPNIILSPQKIADIALQYAEELLNQLNKTK